jgi:hypothetical protein
MKNLEEGFEIAYFTFLNGLQPTHIRVVDAYNRSEQAGKKWRFRDLTIIEKNRDFSTQEIESPGVSFPDIHLNYHGVTSTDLSAFAESVRTHRARPATNSNEEPTGESSSHKLLSGEEDEDKLLEKAYDNKRSKKKKSKKIKKTAKKGTGTKKPKKSQQSTKRSKRGDL